jgi:hypothetical protein
VRQSSTNGGLKVIDRDALTREEMSILEHASSVGNSCGTLARGWASPLLSKLTGSTEGQLLKPGRGDLEATLGFSMGQDTCPHEELDASD